MAVVNSNNTKRNQQIIQPKQAAAVQQPQVKPIGGRPQTIIPSIDQGTVAQPQYPTAAGYQNKYQPQTDAILKQIAQGGEFSYDMDKDQAWQQYAQAYEKQAQKASQDMIGNMAALSGGFGNSYAAAAGAQAYNNQMDQLMAALPQYQQMAYQRWADQRADLYNQLGAYQDADAIGYGRYRDEIGDLRYADETAYGRGRDAIADQRYADETAYQRGRDTIADQRYADETAYQRGRDTIADERYAQEYADKRADTKWQQDYQTGRDAIADKRYDESWQHQLEREGKEDERYAQQWQHQLDREGIEDQRYQDNLDYQRGRDKVEDERWNQQWQHGLDREAKEDERYDQQWKHQLDREGVEDQRYADETAYQRGRDTIADQRYDQQYADSRADTQWSQGMADKEWAGSIVMQMLSEGKMPSAELLAMSGLSEADAQQLKKQISSGKPGPTNDNKDDKGGNDDKSGYNQFMSDLGAGGYQDPDHVQDIPGADPLGTKKPSISGLVSSIPDKSGTASGSGTNPITKFTSSLGDMWGKFVTEVQAQQKKKKQ